MKPTGSGSPRQRHCEQRLGSHHQPFRATEIADRQAPAAACLHRQVVVRGEAILRALRPGRRRRRPDPGGPSIPSSASIPRHRRGLGARRSAAHGDAAAPEPTRPSPPICVHLWLFRSSSTAAASGWTGRGCPCAPPTCQGQIIEARQWRVANAPTLQSPPIWARRDEPLHVVGGEATPPPSVDRGRAAARRGC